jgi:hypothetical protein
MAICKDKSISLLNDLGYNVVRYPKSGIEPLGFVVKQSNKYELVSKIQNLWISELEIPISKREQVPDLNIIESNEIKGGFGIKTLLDIFKVNLNVNGLKDKSIKLVIINPQRVYCDFDSIANFIRKGDVNIDNAVSDFIFDGKSRVFVILETIVSSELKIIISGKSEAEAKVSAEELSENLNANVQFGSSNSNNNEIYFKSNDSAVTFGFKSSEIVFEDGKWSMKLPQSSNGLFLGEHEDKFELLETLNRIEF